MNWFVYTQGRDQFRTLVNMLLGLHFGESICWYSCFLRDRKFRGVHLCMEWVIYLAKLSNFRSVLTFVDWRFCRIILQKLYFKEEAQHWKWCRLLSLYAFFHTPTLPLWFFATFRSWVHILEYMDEYSKMAVLICFYFCLLVFLCLLLFFLEIMSASFL
jgi:hypothetical protein